MVQNLLQGATVQTKDDTIESAIALYFDIIQEHSISLQSQITDNWLENNTVVNDHIANSPISINLRGLSGEIVYTPSTVDGALSYITDTTKNKFGTNIVNKLSVIPALLPPVSNVTQKAMNVISYIEASQNRYSKLIERFTSSTIRQEKLRKIYQNLSALRETKIALFVQTPFGSFDNMYIQSLTLRQANQNYIADIELSLKQLNFTDTLTTQADPNVLAQYSQFQRAQVENHGKIQGRNISELKLIIQRKK